MTGGFRIIRDRFKEKSALAQIDLLLARALVEDIGDGDITTGAVISENHTSEAHLLAKENFVLAGCPFAEKIFRLVNPGVSFRVVKKDGDRIRRGTVIARVSGNTRGLLTAERTAINLLQRLSGIATLTRSFVDKVKGLPVKIMDTRKTTPGIRIFEKYAVRAGGGKNHRFGLFDAILIKDNHINAAGGISRAVGLAKKRVGRSVKIEVEVKNMRQVRSALASGADIIMLDNMSLNDIERSVKAIRDRAAGTIIEASGSIEMDSVRAVAETGVDWISIGALTHSAPAVDISMDIVSIKSRGSPFPTALLRKAKQWGR